MAANTYQGNTTINAGTLVAADSFNGSATFVTSTTITINGGALQLGTGSGTNNVLGTGLNAPNVSIPAITINAGGQLTSAAGSTHNLGQLFLAGGTIAGDPSPPPRSSTSRSTARST